MKRLGTRAASKGWLAERKPEVMLSPPPLLSYGATAFAWTEAVGEGWRWVSHDVRKFFGLLLKKNGYGLEQLFSPLIVHTTPEHAGLKAICIPNKFEHPASFISPLR